MKFVATSLSIALVVMCVCQVDQSEAFKLKKLKKAAMGYMLLQAAKPKPDPMMDMMMMNGECVE